MRIERCMEKKYEEFGVEGRERCPKCWFYKSVCLCGKIAKLRQQASSDLDTEVVVFMHHREFGKASNTGKLAPLVAPTNCRYEIYGTRRGDIALLELCEAKDKQLVILYPSEDSHQLSQFSRKARRYDGSTIETHNASNMRESQKTLVLAVLDSTWSQANRMNKNIPRHIPRVHIDDQVNTESLYLCRRQNPKIIKNVGQLQKSNKVSTIEAIQKALHVLGEPPDILEVFSASLKLTVDSIYAQKGEKAVYGNQISRAVNQGDEKVFGVAKATRPSVCPGCGQKEKRFNNCGRTKYYHVVTSAEDAVKLTVKSTMSGVKYTMLTTDERNQMLAINDKAFENNVSLRKWNCKICKSTFLEEEVTSSA